MNLGMKGLDIHINNGKYNVLVVSCFHGDEKESFNILLRHMLFNKNTEIGFSYIPIANPTGFINNTRENEKGENPNCGFNHPKCKRNMPETQETKCILNNIELIKECSRDGFISLHTDKKSKENYSYTYEQTENPTSFSKSLNFIKFCYCDNTLEDYLYHEGIPLTACLEINNKDLDMIDIFTSFVGRK